MKFTTLELRGKLAATAFYDIINRGMDGILPPSSLLLRTATEPATFLAWLKSSTRPESQVWTANYFYLEPLHEDEVESNEFLIRAVKRQVDGGRMRINIAIEGDHEISTIRLDFNGRFNLAFAGHALNDLRTWLTENKISWDGIDIRMEGYIREQHTSERLLAAFSWDEQQGHMIHKYEKRPAGGKEERR